MWRVLCVDDDEKKAAEVAEFLTTWKVGNPYGDFTAVVETSFTASLERLSNERFDLVTLDLHGSQDPDPGKGSGDNREQEGKQVLDELKKRRFVPVIFYTGFAEKIADLETGVVRVVKKGQDDLAEVRKAAEEIYKTGLPKLVRHIEKEERDFIWETVDKHWDKLNGDSDQLCYLLARRLAAQFNRQSVKDLLGHTKDVAKPIEHYIYPAIAAKIKTGNICKTPDGKFWIVMTPSCDFALGKAENILLVGLSNLADSDQYKKWSGGEKWKGVGAAPSTSAQTAWEKLTKLIRNNAGDRFRFLPGTFFFPSSTVDLQVLKQVKLPELDGLELVCQLDNPYRQELLLHFSKYYGRLGTPNLDADQLLAELA